MHIEEWNETNLQSLIQNQVQESVHLDYKGSSALNDTERNKNEISKDVSSFANSDGGMIIYGIEEIGHIPTRIDGGIAAEGKREWLEQVIDSRIHPRISGIIIKQIDLSSHLGYAVFVVKIPIGFTAHQAHDLKYYRRHNFRSVPMHDYEVKMVMDRFKEPKLRAIERHSSDLRDLAKRWLQQLPPIFQASRPNTSEQPLVEIRIDKEHLFLDLKNHIPSDLILLEVWEKFKKDLNEYDKKRYSLFQEILEDCKRRTELPHDPDLEKGYGFSTSFVSDIYSDIFRVVEGHEPNLLSEQVTIKPIDKNYELRRISHLLALGSEEGMERAKKVREEFLNELRTSKYIAKARDLLKDQKSLQEINNDLRKCINDFIAIPLYRGECKYIKWSV